MQPSLGKMSAYKILNWRDQAAGTIDEIVTAFLELGEAIAARWIRLERAFCCSRWCRMTAHRERSTSSIDSASSGSCCRSKGVKTSSPRRSSTARLPNTTCSGWSNSPVCCSLRYRLATPDPIPSRFASTQLDHPTQLQEEFAMRMSASRIARSTAHRQGQRNHPWRVRPLHGGSPLNPNTADLMHAAKNDRRSLSWRNRSAPENMVESASLRSQ